MRPALLLLLFAASALAQPDSFIQPYIQPGEFYYYQQTNYSSKTYFVVWVNATETFVLEQTATGAYSFVNSSSIILGVLRQNFLDTVSIDGELDGLRQRLADFNASRQPSQAECEVMTGTDHLPCTDPDSCLQACLSVPSCRAYNQPSGGALVHAILEWRNNNSMLDGNLTLYASNLSFIEGRTGDIEIAVNSAEMLLDRMFQPVEAIGQNKLFRECPDCFNYCRPIPFDTLQLNASRSLLSALRRKLSRLDELPSVALLVQQRTYARTNRVRFQFMLENMTGELDNLTALAAPLATMRDRKLDEDMASLSSMLSQVRSYGQNENYGPAFELEDDFAATAGRVRLRIAALTLILNRYNEMVANATMRRSLLRAQADPVLRDVNDTELSRLLEKVDNITSEMNATAEAGDYASALELEDDFGYYSSLALERAQNTSSKYSALVAKRDEASLLLANLTASIRENETDFLGELQNLSARFNALQQRMHPVQEDEIASVTDGFSQLSRDAGGLLQRVDERRVAERKEQSRRQLVALYNLLINSRIPRMD